MEPVTRSYSKFSCPSFFSDWSIFSLNLPQIQPLQEPQGPTTSTDFNHNFRGRLGRHVHLRLPIFFLPMHVHIDWNWPAWEKQPKNRQVCENTVTNTESRVLLLAYGCREWNSNWPIKIQQASRQNFTVLVSVCACWQERHSNWATFLAGDGVKYSWKGIKLILDYEKFKI